MSGKTVVQPFKPVCQLTGTDGNVFALLAQTRQALKDAGQRDAANELLKRIVTDREAASYDAAIQIMCEYVEAV